MMFLTLGKLRIGNQRGRVVILPAADKPCDTPIAQVFAHHGASTCDEYAALIVEAVNQHGQLKAQVVALREALQAIVDECMECDANGLVYFDGKPDVCRYCGVARTALAVEVTP